MESSMEVPQKTENRTTISPSDTIGGKGKESVRVKNILTLHVYNAIHCKL
jgi:hypothetical protein